MPQFEPGDVLLYNDGGMVDRLIAFRTWSDVAHIEISLGDWRSAASRNGIGAGIFPQRLSGLKYIYRPIGNFDLKAAEKFARKFSGTPYGWLDLLQFYGLKLPCKGIICSTYGDLLLRKAGIITFSTAYDSGAVSPRDFKLSPALKKIWSR